MINNSVETANEAGGRHRGRPGLHTVNEEVDHIVFHNDHVEHDVNDGTDDITYANGEQIDIVTENEKTEAEAEGIESTSTDTTLNVSVGTAGVTGEEHSDRSTVNEESGCFVGGDHHARCAHPVDEAGSIVFYVSNDMSEEKKTVKKQTRQQQQMILRRFQKKMWKSEDSLRKEEAHPKKRNNDEKK